MSRMMTIGKQIAIGVLLPYTALVILVVPSVFHLLGKQIKAHQLFAHTQGVLIGLNQLLSSSLQVEHTELVYLVTGRDDSLSDCKAAFSDLAEHFQELRRLMGATADHRQPMEEIERLVRERQIQIADNSALRRKLGPLAAQVSVEQGGDKRQHDAMLSAISRIKSAEEDVARQRARDSEQTGEFLVRYLVIIIPLFMGTAVLLVSLSIRKIGRQVSAMVQHMRSSAAELQVAATQQKRGAKAQASTATEVATTMNQLVSTARQIADSTQHVNGVAADAAAAARTGDTTVQGAQVAVDQVKQQVARIVFHMLDLGRCTQEIGGILDIINELAEQTNILAINATIEAAGAGDAGRRFAVVAEEIRKLADRVGVSTKEIRGLIEKVRGAANTTVLVTEDGTKSVERSTRHFNDVAVSLLNIVELIGTTAGAISEIELTIKQQTSAVSQVSTAINEVAETARETERSSGQIMQTAEELTALSGQLLQLVRSSEAAPQSAAAS